MGYLLNLLAPPGLMPQGYCLLWQPGLIWLHAVAGTIIGVSFFAIPLVLAVFLHRRRDLAFGWIFWLFMAFILACGATHLIEVATLWHPVYGLQGAVKAITAMVSLAIAIALWPLATRAMALPMPGDVRRLSVEADLHETERDQALGELRQTEENLRLLVSGVIDYAIYMLDPQGHITTWNAGAQRMKGYQAEEILGRHFSTFYTPEDRAAGLPARVLETARREGKFEGEGWRVRKDGSRFWASVVVDALHDDAGQFIGFAKITRDITERRETQLALEQARTALAQAQKMETIGQLAGGIAHDFNNLLTTVLSAAELLEHRVGQHLTADAKKLLSAIREGVQRGAKLTYQLLAFSRKQTLAPQVVDANKLIASMSELLRRTLEEKIAIETVLAGGLWRTHVDPNQLENAILNLAVNARDAMPEGGRLTLETGNVYLDEAYAATHSEVAPGQYVMLAVSDTGTGMSAEVLEKAFEPFFTTKPEGQGTGLGLSQVFGFVKQSGGHVGLYSEPGAGTSVKLYLPRYQGMAEGGAPLNSLGTDVPRGHETMMIVEDDVGVRTSVAGSLRHLGYRVIEATDGQHALSQLPSQPEITLLLTDIGLPGMNGRQIAEQARKLNPALKVIFMTGYARNAISHQGVLEPGLDVLPKPFTMDALARKLREVLDRPARVAQPGKP